MKKLTSALILASVVSAFGPTVNAGWEYNFLIGASAGYGDRSANFEFNSIHTVAGAVPTDVKLNYTDDGFIWGLLAGVQATCNGWLFGAELHLDWADFDQNTPYTVNLGIPATPAFLNARYERGTSLALSARGGYQMTPYLLPYFRVGVEVSDDKLITNGVYATIPSTTFHFEDSRNIYRLLLGAGLEIPLHTIPGLALRGEYNYHAKGKRVSSSGATNDLLNSVGVNMKPDEHAGKFSIVWNFI